MKNRSMILSETLSGSAQTEKRLAAIAERRSQSSFHRFIESMDGEGFEFRRYGMFQASRS